MAKIIIKSGFTLVADDHRQHEFVAGEQEIPDELADHWYVKAHCEPLPEAYDVPEAVTADEPVADPVPEPEEGKRRPGRPKRS